MATRLGGQSLECQEALHVENQIKEKIAAGGADLGFLHNRVKTQTQSCKTLSSLWRLRESLAEKIGDHKDARLAHDALSGDRLLSDPEFQALIASGPASFDPTKPPKTRWALLAGSGGFQDRHIRQIEFAGSDLMEIHSLLVHQFGFQENHILEATGQNFTSAGFKNKFSSLREQVEPPDLVFVFVISHGFEGADDANGSSILLTYDSDTQSSTRRYETGIELIGLVQEVFRELRAQRIVLVLDTCFSGDAITGQRNSNGQPSPYFLDLVTQNSGRVVITAAGADQRSWGLPERKRGALAYCFSDAAHHQVDGIIGEMFAEASSCVTREVEKLDRKPIQEPKMFASEAARRTSLGTPPTGNSNSGNRLQADDKLMVVLRQSLARSTGRVPRVQR